MPDPELDSLLLPAAPFFDELAGASALLRPVNSLPICSVGGGRRRPVGAWPVHDMVIACLGVAAVDGAMEEVR